MYNLTMNKISPDGLYWMNKYVDYKENHRSTILDLQNIIEQQSWIIRRMTDELAECKKGKK